MDLGAYRLRSSVMDFKAHPLYRRLAPAAEWACVASAGHLVLHVQGMSGRSADYGPAQPCADGEWLPPLAMPALHDLAREVACECTTITLRRIGSVSVPLGLGPVYGCGPRRGQPSSAYGSQLQAIYDRAIDPDHTWCQADDADLERVIFLAFQQCYHLTEELWAELAPYDDDEVSVILNAMLAIDPLASGDAGDWSQPSPPDA